MQHRIHGRGLTCACLAVLALVTSSCAGGTTDAPEEVTDRAATLRATGSPGGEATQWWFEYGKTTSYGTSTPRRDGGSGTAEQTVSARVTGLTPDTLYHYRACASNRSGTGCAKDVTFRTGSDGLLPGFQETTAWSGLEAPTAVRFAPDGRVFVAEKPGGIKVFDGLGDTTPTTFANLRTQVSHYHDQGLLGLAIHPQFPAEPYVYVLYTHDAPVGGTAPTWNDLCPTPPGPNPNGCVTSGRLSHLEARGNVSVREQVLVEDWCQQSFTHSVGDLGFGSDGALYVSAGDGASPDFVDYGQFGVPKNPCGDPPVGVGGTQSAPTSQGGALRSQDRLTPSDAQTLDGALLRVDAFSGAGLSSNPFASSTDPKARRLVAYGLRNPFRFTVRPGTREVWIGDVGWNTSEEINRIPDAGDAVAENFGWPCHEGNVRQGGYDAANLDLCEILYAAGGPAAPTFTYQHSGKITTDDTCPVGTSSVSGMDFNPAGSPWPGEFDGALFFADYARGCIWAMRKGASGLPAPAGLRWFRTAASVPVDLQFGPDGALYYADIANGRIRRIAYTGGNQAPRAVVRATPTSGDVPLPVQFNAGDSSDPDGDALSYAWDLDGDGQYDDSTAATPLFTYFDEGSYLAGLQVTDPKGATATDRVAITAGDTPPMATISSPSPGLAWKVGDLISFSGSASDREEGAIPANRLSWTLLLNHCPSNCHTHVVESWDGVSSGSFAAPDHEYPSHLELRLTARDNDGLTDTRSVRLDPRTVSLEMRTVPSGLSLAVNSIATTTPFSVNTIQGSTNTITASLTQTLAGATYDFGSWSDGGVRSHAVTPNASGTYTATYNRR